MQGDGWNRRRFLIAVPGVIAGVAALAETGFAAKGKAVKVALSAGTDAPRLEAPANTTDCHHHIYDYRYPFAPSVTMKPPEALLSEYRLLQQRLGMSRSVVVQPSHYGTDNSLVLASMKALGPKKARGIAVVAPSISDAELKQMQRAGMRGMRFNLLQKGGGTNWQMMEPLAKRFAAIGWHVQIQAAGEDIYANKELLNRLPCPVVFDHLAHVQDAGHVKDQLFAMVCDLMKQGKAWVKITFEESKVGPPSFSDTVAVASEYVKKVPGRLVWASNWPHPGSAVKPDDAAMFDLLAAVSPDAKVRKQILAENAAKLYGF